ncbi:MAG TPA: hypothetical protein VHE81_23425 [Lacipirellulaceae bacterium]|nr:hypothetical protein [Lacipirellulaceae bacterium]
MSPADPSAATSTNQSAPSSDELFGPWNNRGTAPQATISRNGHNSTQVTTRRQSELPSYPPLAKAPPEVDKPNTSSDPWKNQSQSSTTGLTTTSSWSGNTSQLSTQPPANSPFLNPPAVGSTGNNINIAGQNSSGAQQGTQQNATQANRPTAPSPGPQQPWGPMVVAVLSLAGSLAANLFLGWSYLDARQKYQSLVRRTADTFRRAKAAAA